MFSVRQRTDVMVITSLPQDANKSRPVGGLS